MKVIIKPVDGKEYHLLETVKAFDPYCTIESVDPFIVHTVVDINEIKGWTSVKEVSLPDSPNKFSYVSSIVPRFTLSDLEIYTKGLSSKSIISFTDYDDSRSWVLARKWTNVAIEKYASTVSVLKIFSTNSTFDCLYLEDINDWKKSLGASNSDILFDGGSSGGFVVGCSIKSHPTLLVPEIQLSFREP